MEKYSLLQEAVAGNKQNEEDTPISCNKLNDVCDTNIQVVDSVEMSNDNTVDEDVAEHADMVTHF